LAYLTTTSYLNFTGLPSEYHAEVEARYPGWITEQIGIWGEVIDSRLRKRYPVPFAVPIPVSVQMWLARLLDARLLLKRGVDATDAQYADFAKSAADVMSELKEAADSNTGLYDLPLTALGDSAIKREQPMSFSNAGPYAGFRSQRERSYSDE
jgi:hypothetical protein